MLLTKKRGQITLFIILALIILAVVGFVVYTKGLIPIPGKEALVSEQIKPLKSFVDDCVYRTAEIAIALISQQGGYYTVENGLDVDISYFFYEGKNTMPLLSAIEDELADYVELKLDGCINLSNSVFTGFDVSKGKVDVIARILKGKVLFEVNYPLGIKKEGYVFLLEEFKLEIPVRSLLVYDISNEIVQQLIAEPETICMSCLADIAERNNLKIDVTYYSGDTLIFTIEDESSVILDFPYNFLFAAKFDLDIVGGVGGEEL